MCKMKNKFKIMFAFLGILFAFLCFSNFKVNASFNQCNTKIKGTKYYDCGDIIYTYPEDKNHSSYLISYDGGNIVYAGEKNGYSVFYINGFYYYNTTYDDRGSQNNNIWTILKTHDKVLFDGSFKDSWIVDESHTGLVRSKGNYDSYIIEQYYNNGQLLRKMVVYNIFNNDYGAVIDDYYKVNDIDLIYDKNILDPSKIEEVVDVEDSIFINSNSNFGIKKLIISVNNKEAYDVDAVFNSCNVTDYIMANLDKGINNKAIITAYNYLGFKKEVSYNLFYVGNDANITFETISSNVVSSSRRIVVNALPGKGKKLDTDYCWYYWSSNPNDVLTEDDFLRNYAKSEYKGSYSEDKGVILRNTVGTYYLYALAKDDDSSVVVRSDGYTLDKEFEVRYNLNDLIFILVLLNLCVIPLLIYLFIKKRGY